MKTYEKRLLVIQGPGNILLDTGQSRGLSSSPGFFFCL